MPVTIGRAVEVAVERAAQLLRQLQPTLVLCRYLRPLHKPPRVSLSPCQLDLRRRSLDRGVACARLLLIESRQLVGESAHGTLVVWVHM